MSSAARALWKAVDAALLADSALVALLADPTAAYAEGDVPESAPLPFLTYGASGETHARTFGGAGNDGTLQINVRAENKDQALEIAEAVVRVLDDVAITVTGHSLTEGTCALVADFPDPSGSHNAVLRYSALTEAVA